MTYRTGGVTRRYRTEQTILALLLAGFGVLKGIRLLVDALDDAVTLPRSTM